MGIPVKARQSVLWVAATAAAALTTLVLVWLGANVTVAGMVFLVLVVWWATQSGIVLSIYIAVLCALFFDYFFLPPVRTLWLEGAQAWVAMVSFAVSCVVVSRLSEHARHQTQRAEQRQADVERLYALSQEMMLFEDADRLLRDLPGAMNRIFALESVILYVSDQDRFYASGGEAPASVKAHMQAVTQGLSPTATSFAGYQATALALGLRTVGALAWRPDALSLEVATAVSAQVSIAVARSMAIAASTRIEAAREADRLRTALTDSLTHELRTPLTSIRAAATTLLQGEGLDEAGRDDMVRIIDEEASRLDQLIGEAVEMAEIDANVVQVKMSPQSPHDLLELAVEKSRTTLAAHKVTILDDAPNESAESEELVWFDSHLLGRVLRHLLENAASHTPPGTRVRLSSTRRDKRLEFCVEDNGPGIDAHDLPLIFEKFYRGKRGANRHKGSGMGLAITRAILKAHGGGIEGTSTPGSGAKFRFWVPLIDREPSSKR
ncbi:MAG: ATP-binding protein [Terracidiphilus sp.]|jgi:two-component system sensor histidine kinase KdpD